MPRVVISANAKPSRDDIENFIERAAISQRQLPLWNEMTKNLEAKDRGRVFLRLDISWRLDEEKREVRLLCNLGKFNTPYVTGYVSNQQEADELWRAVMAYVDNEWPKVLAAHAKLKKVRKEMNTIMCQAKHEFDDVLRSTIHA